MRWKEGKDEGMRVLEKGIGVGMWGKERRKMLVVEGKKVEVV